MRVGGSASGVRTRLLLLLLLLVPLNACGGGMRLTRDGATRAGVRGHRALADRDLLVRRSVTIGYSVDRRPIRAVFIGDPDVAHPLLLVGCIHGNEPAGIAIARRLLAVRSQSEPEPALWIVPDLNPDGVAAATRQNARGVDLNRNFPFGWKPLSSPGDLFYQGPRPLSEPESRAIYRFILRIRPSVSIWFHQHLDLVDLSGGDPQIERRFAQMVRLPAHRLTRYPGSAVGWENHVDPRATAFVVELPAGSLPASAVNRYASATLELARQAEHSDVGN